MYEIDLDLLVFTTDALPPRDLTRLAVSFAKRLDVETNLAFPLSLFTVPSESINPCSKDNL